MSDTFFHVSKTRLSEGDILIKGRYGKRVLGKEGFDNFHKHKELVFETVRKHLISKAPSRLDCVFLFKRYESACVYRYKHHNYRSFIYEVELLEGAVYEVDNTWLDLNVEEVKLINEQEEPPNIKMSEDIFIKKAAKYWKKEIAPESLSMETLTNGKVEVKRLLVEPFYI